MLSRGKNSLSTQRHKGRLFRWVQTRPKLRPMASTHAYDLAMLRSSDAHQLSREWEALTGDSFIVDVRPMYGEIDGFLETFKYALKFSDLELSDNLHAYKTLKGKRLINSFGALRGVESTRRINRRRPRRWLALHADALHLPKRVRLQFSEQWTEDLSWNITSKAPKATGLHRATAIPKTKRSLCFHSRPNVAVCFQSGRLHAPQTVLNTLKGYSLHFAMQSRS